MSNRRHGHWSGFSDDFSYSDNKLKFGDVGHQEFELYEAVFSSPSCGATIEATGEEVLRINLLQPDPEAPGR